MAYSRLRRTSDQRKALLRDLVTDIIINERIVTTEAKAKELKKLADKMITLAKEGTLASRRQAAETVRFEDVKEGQNALQKLFSELGPRYQDRNGGYTRIIKTVPRRGDAAPMAIIEFV
ncbi:MAG TPA: 50S ribosomal protein L17 [Acholeplasmataceae bacterium]|jgi:large subunit ribosomal protein L17|nr:50S ribosomal protein L17 [Acholeplasmataceae bacterium]HPG42446.1 50S ribosomal protein L17 [Acholeplasmataceae bacterium]HRX44521.1 50S ribosomal protein L17 [Acholeplasmataceae bacterium]